MKPFSFIRLTDFKKLVRKNIESIYSDIIWPLKFDLQKMSFSYIVVYHKNSIFDKLGEDSYTVYHKSEYTPHISADI